MLLLIYYCAAAMLLWRGLFHVLNHMGRHSCNATRFAWLFITTGAAQILLAPAFGAIPAPSLGDVVLLSAVAGYFLTNQSKGRS
jgi:hypothetical protein